MITSHQNPLIKKIRRLRKSKRAREKEGLFIVEGIQGVVEAVEQDAPIDTLVYAPELLTSNIAQTAIEKAQHRNIYCQAITSKLFKAISGRENPVGLSALIKRHLTPLEALPVPSEGLYVALFEIGDPGNLGTILRTLDAAGGNALILVGSTVDPFHPTTVKASAGTIFSIPIVHVPQLETLVHWAQQHHITIIGTSDQATQSYWQTEYPAPLLLLMGSEAHGLPDAYLTNAQSVRIPMYGQADSLNLGVATALVLYEVRRRWGKRIRGVQGLPCQRRYHK